MLGEISTGSKENNTMRHLVRKHSAQGMALAVAGFCGVTAMAQTTVSVPKATQLPITFFAPEMNNSPSDNFPLITEKRTLRPHDLKKNGYVEEEYLVSGNANVYEWTADGKLNVVTPNAPYTTRI